MGRQALVMAVALVLAVCVGGHGEDGEEKADDDYRGLGEFYSERCPLSEEDWSLPLHPHFRLYLSAFVTLVLGAAIASVFLLCYIPCACIPQQRLWILRWEEYEVKLRDKENRRRRRKSYGLYGQH